MGACSRDSRTYRSDRAIEDTRDFAVAEALDVAEDDGEAKLRLQLREECIDLVTEHVAEHLLVVEPELTPPLEAILRARRSILRRRVGYPVRRQFRQP